MRINIENSFSTLIGTPAEVRLVDAKTKVRKPGYLFSRAYKNGYWDGFIKFVKNGKVPTGLLPFIIAACDEYGVAIEVQDHRVSRAKIEIQNQAILPKKIESVRDYQEESVNKILTNTLLNLPFRRGVIEIGTAGGKSLILGMLCRKIVGNCLILVNSQDLLYQTSEDVSNFIGEVVGRIGDSKEEYQRVIVATTQTLHRHKEAFQDYLNMVDAVFVDECHHTSASTFVDILNMCNHASIKVGMSGTPFKKNDPVHNMTLRAMLGEQLVNIGSKELIKKQVVSDVEVLYYIIDKPETDDSLSWAKAYDTLIVHNEYRNSVIAAWAKTRDKPTIIIVDRYAHGKILSELCDCIFVTGKESSQVRKQVVKDLDSGKITLIVCTRIFDEGINAPNIKYIALAIAGKSIGRFRQRIGRRDAPIWR